jgi:hypothetical protein
MAKSSARKTADAIHNIPEYYGPQVDEPTDGMKKGDIWFTTTTRTVKAKQEEQKPQRKPLKRITDLRPKVKQLRSKKNAY